MRFLAPPLLTCVALATGCGGDGSSPADPDAPVALPDCACIDTPEPSRFSFIGA